jgi:polysaccharide biosynthesis/export protein
MLRIALLGMVGLAACLSAQTPGNLPARKIVPNDLLSISVYGSPELTRSVRVGMDGTIRLPMLAPLSAQGSLPDELEGKIASALSKGGILVDPAVTVAIAEYSSRPISVAGAVRRPTTFQVTETTTLLEALTRAEGVTPEAGGDILITRPGANRMVERVSLRGLVEQGDSALNVKLEGGEEVRVAQLGRVFVVGNVKHPGAFRLEDDSGLSVLKALALAEGLSPFSAKEAFIYHRADSPGGSAPKETPIALRKILDREAADVELAANDILYVPDNRHGRATAAALERALSFAIGTASGALILGVNR